MESCYIYSLSSIIPIIVGKGNCFSFSVQAPRCAPCASTAKLLQWQKRPPEEERKWFEISARTRAFWPRRPRPPRWATWTRPGTCWTLWSPTRRAAWASWFDLIWLLERLWTYERCFDKKSSRTCQSPRRTGTPDQILTGGLPLRSYIVRIVPYSTPCFKMSANPHEYWLFYRTACCGVSENIA